MDIVRRVVAVFLIVTGIAVAVHLAVTPLYHDGSEDYTVWAIFNWFMAVGVVIVLLVGIARKRAVDRTEEVDAITALRASIVFYGSIVLAMLFFWEWFWTLNPDSETGLAVNSHMIYFPLVDALYVVLTLMVGRRIWSGGGN